MEQFKPIELGDKEVFDLFFKQDPPWVSELTFTNLFIASRIWELKGYAKPRNLIVRIIWCISTSLNLKYLGNL